MPSSQVSSEANRDTADESGNLRQIDGPDESEAQDTRSTGVNTRSKHDKAIQVNFANEIEAHQTGSTGVNTRSKHDKAVQVNFSDEKENHRNRQNIICNKCGQEAASARISTKSECKEAAQVNFVVEKDQQGLQAVISDKNNHVGGHRGPFMESECEEAVEPGVNEREDNNTDEDAKDFNGGVALVGLFHVESSKANKNKDDDAIIGEAIRGEFHESVQEKEDGEHSSKVHANVQEAARSEFHSNVQVEGVHKINYTSENDKNKGLEAVGSEYYVDVQAEVVEEHQEKNCEVIMNEGKEAVESEYHENQAHVAKDNDRVGSCTNRAEINENVQTDVAKGYERHYTNVADINSRKEAIEIEYHEIVLADVSVDGHGGNCSCRVCINEEKEAIENVHHGGVETDVAEDDEQRGNYTSESDKNKGLQAVESEYYVDVQAEVVEEHQGKNCEAIMNEGKEAIEIEYHEIVLADVSEDGHGGNCRCRVGINEEKEDIENVHHGDVETDVAEDDEQRGNYTSEGDKNTGLENVESEYHVHVQADDAEGHQERNYISEVIMNEGKEAVESDF
jgi:hypothetical protein